MSEQGRKHKIAAAAASAREPYANFPKEESEQLSERVRQSHDVRENKFNEIIE